MKGETKLFVGIIAVTIVIVGIGVALLSRPPKPVIADPALLVHADSNTISTSSATMTLVEFSDFQCPACGTYYDMVKQIVEKYKDSLTFVYRNYPLTDLHPNATIAAAAAEAAGMQGKYWEMYDMLFSKQNDWATSTTARDIFTQYAQSLGLHVDRFIADVDSDTVKSRIAVDIKDGNSIGINATPTFFLNNRKIDNPATLADFEILINKALVE